MTPAALLFVLGTTEAGAPSPEAVPAVVREPVRPPNIVVPAVHGIVLMAVMRTTESVIWPNPFSRPGQFGAAYEETFTRPPKFETRQPFMRWDGDPFFVNTVGHALFGSELYLRARQCRFGWAGSFAFAAATSAVWEYAVEGNGARPSALDLVYTPLAGMALGELRYVVHRVAGGLSSPAARGIVRAVVDPLGDLERAFGTEC